MNPLTWPTLILWAVLFVMGRRINAERRGLGHLLIWSTAVAVALPGMLFAAYYTKLMGEPVWLYQFRSVPGSELCASGSGLLFGVLQRTVQSHPHIARRLGKLLVPLLGVFAAILPFLKPAIGPLPDSAFTETWREGVCLQSTPSTCGPASAATLLRHLGIVATERELARESYSSRTGTENWYLARALRRRGLEVRFQLADPSADGLKAPAIAGVRNDGFGHFIALLSQTNGMVEVADPLNGPERISAIELTANRRFTGFFMTVRLP
jgi:hypothetical protein